MKHDDRMMSSAFKCKFLSAARVKKNPSYTKQMYSIRSKNKQDDKEQNEACTIHNNIPYVLHPQLAQLGLQHVLPQCARVVPAIYETCSAVIKQ